MVFQARLQSFSRSICASATCAISGTGGTNLSMSITKPENAMLRYFGYILFHGCRFQI